MFKNKIATLLNDYNTFFKYIILAAILTQGVMMLKMLLCHQKNKYIFKYIQIESSCKL